MDKNITLNINGIHSFATKEEVNSVAGEAVKHLQTLKSGTGCGNDFLGWLHLPDEASKEAGRIMDCAGRLRSQAPVTVVVGIGGSYLGAKALIGALNDPFTVSGHRVVFAGQHSCATGVN